MNKRLLSLCVASILTFPIFQLNETASADQLDLDSKCCFLMDADSHTVMYEKQPFLHVPIASVCKVMTLTLVFDAIKQGDLKFDDVVVASEHAASMGGSQVYLQAGASYNVSQLIKSIVVCSANDSCVALSEKVCGNEQAFVNCMNDKAKELGCKDTVFANCTGLPKMTQYSCAHDVALMFAELIKNKEYFSYSKVWLEDFEHPNNRVTSMTNTNKLIKNYRLCDGGKTGFTNEAGFCLASTACQNGLRLISVVLGAHTGKDRFNDAVSLFEYGFGAYENKIVLDGTMPLNDDFLCDNGKRKFYSVKPKENCSVLLKKGEQANVNYEIVSYDIKAPIVVGQIVGKVNVYVDNVLYKEVEIVSLDEVKKQGYGDKLKDVAGDWCL